MSEMNRPNPAVLAEEYRNRGVEFVDYLMRWLTESEPQVAERWGRAMKYHLLAAFQDAYALDQHAANAGRARVFLRSFMDSIFCSEGFMPALFEFSRMPFDKKAFGPVLGAMKNGKDTRAAHLLVLFREKMKDGWSVKDALRHHGKDIGREFAKGNDWLLDRLVILR